MFGCQDLHNRIKAIRGFEITSFPPFFLANDHLQAIFNFWPNIGFEWADMIAWTDSTLIIANNVRIEPLEQKAAQCDLMWEIQ